MNADTIAIIAGATLGVVVATVLIIEKTKRNQKKSNESGEDK